MSEENVEIVRRSYEAFMRGDGEAALSAYSPDAEWDDTRFRPEGKVHRGRDEISALVRRWVGTWTDYSIKLERVIEAGNRVVVIYEERGTGKGSGLKVNTQVGMVISLGGDRSHERSSIRIRSRPSKPPGCGSRGLATAFGLVGGAFVRGSWGKVPLCMESSGWLSAQMHSRGHTASTSTPGCGSGEHNESRDPICG
jgi:uncharacterized protein